MSLLSVTVKKARYVGAQAQHYSTYVTLKLQNVKSTTVTVKGANPCWEQDFLFETNNVNTGLLVEVWCKGMIWDRALGYSYIPLRDIQYSNEEGSGQWVSLDAEILMREGEVIGTAGPTGDSLLLDCRFELPFGRYDPPSGWKALLAPDSERRSGPRSLGDEDNTDWLPLGQQSLPDYWSGRDAENTAGDALQRKLERLNSTIVGHDEQSRRQYQYYGQTGYSEDSDYTSDLNYPIGQHPNSSASQFKSAAQLMRTPERSLETSRENSYERDDAPGQGHLQGSHHLPPNQGRIHQQSYRNYNETDGEPLYYNSRPRDYKEYSSQEWYRNQYSKKDPMYEQPKPYNGKRAGRRPSLERQTTLYDDQYYPDQQYYDGTEKQQHQQHQQPQQYETYTAQNFGDFYSQDYGYQNESFGQEEEDKQWDSGGYYYRDNFEISPSDNYQNVINRARSSKKLPQVTSYNSSEDANYYTPQRGMSYEDEPVDNNTTISASARRKLLKQQRHSSENYTSTTNWTSAENWSNDNDCNYYDAYNTANTNIVPPVVPPVQPHKKRTLPQIRVPSRNRMSAVSLPQIPGPRQLPNPPVGVNKQRTSAPVSRTTSNDYDQNDVYGTGSYNENYNYAYESNDNLPNDKFGDYPTDIRTSGNFQSNYDNIQDYANNYQSVDNYPGTIENYQNTNENFQNFTAPENLYNRNQPVEDYYSPDYYEEEEDNLKKYYETDVTQGLPQKSFLERRPISPFTQQNTDSLESKDDELRNESFETAYESICSSIPVQKPSTEYSSTDLGMEYKPEPPKQQEQQSTGVLGGLLGQLTRSPSSYIQQQQQQQNQQQQQQQQQQQTQKPEQRSRDQSNLLTNPALAAMNVTKGFLSSLTNVVNNTVQNINKQQQKPQQQQQQQPESQAQQVQRIQVTKRGSLKQEEINESQTVVKNRQNSFDSQIHDYRIPEEPEYLEEEEEEDKEDGYYEQPREYYDYDGKGYYEDVEESGYQREDNHAPVSELDLLKSRLESENLKKRTAHLKHQDTIESEGKMSDINNRNYLRQQDSLDSCAEEMMMHNSALINGHRASPDLDRYEDTRTGVIEPLRSGSPEGNRLDSPRKRGRDNSLIEPYHPSLGQEVPKGYSPSPPAIQKQQSVDLEGIEEEEEEEEEVVPEDVKVVPEEIKKVEPEPEEPVKTVVPERRKMTAKERWHRAYNVVVQQLNVSRHFNLLYLRLVAIWMDRI